MSNLPQRRILFVDDDADFRATRAEFLIDAYYVIEAGSDAEAEAILQEQWVHLAIFDIRMRNGNDERDVSGLRLAKKAAYRAIPKIMLTNYPSYEAVREALGASADDMPPAVGFLAKQEGAGALLQAIEAAFQRDVRINWTLHIQSGGRQPITFPYLAALIESDLNDRLLQHRSGELVDAFRRLFYEQEQIRLERLLWRQPGRVALSVLAFTPGLPPVAFVVVCSSRLEGVTEAQRYDVYAPKALSATSTLLSLKSETTHYAINAYSLAHVELEQTEALIERYRHGSERGLATAFESLLQQTLAAWHGQHRASQEHASLIDCYRLRLGLNEEQSPRDALEERLHHLRRQLAAIGVWFEHDHGQMMARGFGPVAAYPDPMSLIDDAVDDGQPVLVINVPGQLTGYNVLTDADGGAWLTDFSEAGPAPELWSYVALEAAVRFDWIETTDIRTLYALATLLTASPLHPMPVSDIEPPILRKPVRAIQTIRRLAAEQTDDLTTPYLIGLLLQAASRLATCDATLQLTVDELRRFAYIWVSAAMIAQQLDAVATPSTASGDSGIRIDQQNRAVWIDGRRVRFSGQSYNLLCYLYNHAGRLCHRRDIVEHVLGLEFDERDESQSRRLNTAMSRLRERLGDDPRQPRYLFTETGGGYRLVIRP